MELFSFIKDVAIGAYKTVGGAINGVVHAVGGAAQGFTEGFSNVAFDRQLLARADMSSIRRMEVQVFDTVDCVNTTHRDVKDLMAVAKCVAEKINNLDIFIRDSAQKAAQALDHIQDVQERTHQETTARLIVIESNSILSEVGDLNNNIEKLKGEVERKKIYIQDFQQKDQNLSFILLLEIIAILFVGYPLVFSGGSTQATQQNEVNAMADEVSVLLESLQTKIKNLEDGNSRIEQAWMKEKMQNQDVSYMPLIAVAIVIFMFMILCIILLLKKSTTDKPYKKTNARKSVSELRVEYEKAMASAKED